MSVLIVSFYRFEKLPALRLEACRKALEVRGQGLNLRGLVILAEEGVNAGIAGEAQAVKTWVESCREILGHAAYLPKESWAEKNPFRRFKVQIRPELITFDGSCFEPREEDQKTHLSPAQWHEWLRSGRDFTLLDTRNWYETKLGVFRRALDPHISSFTELMPFLEERQVSKDKPLLMYCTGGVRCEKAAPALKAAGFSEVYQLDGGILRYLEEFPGGEFEGECYVFDHRVAVDQRLGASKNYGLCPHCGNPASRKETCGNCSQEFWLCDSCQKAETKSCSKNCDYHLKGGPRARLRISEERLPGPR